MLLLLHLLLENEIILVVVWHILYHIFSRFSDNLLIAYIDLILISSTAGCRSDISGLQALDSIRKDPIVLSIFDILSLNFLEVSSPHGQLMPLVTQLLFVTDTHLVDFFLEVYFLLVACGIGVLLPVCDLGQTSAKLTNVLNNVLSALNRNGTL